MNNELSKGFTGVEINGVRFTNISEMLQYMDKQRDRITELETHIEKMKSDIKQEQSYWNTCDMQYDLYQRLLDKWEIRK